MKRGQNHVKPKELAEATFSRLLHVVEAITSKVRLLLMPAWKRNPRAVSPADRLKQQVVKDYAKMFSIRTLIETGTFVGKMVQATKDDFERIITIELGEDLAREAQGRFGKLSHIQVIQGDSAEILPKLLQDIDERSLFWLDAHYSGPPTIRGPSDTPVTKEIQAILQHHIRDHVILIDDARAFGQGDYPALHEIQTLVRQLAPCHALNVDDDIIRIIPGTEASRES